MSAFLTMAVAWLLAALPRVLMGMAATLLTDEILRRMLSYVGIALARRAAKLSTTKADDELVEIVADALLKPTDPPITGASDPRLF